MDSLTQATPESPTAITVEWEANEYSQSGEDGIISKVLELIHPRTSGLCIDIGANDGYFCSNTAALRKRGWISILIECDPMHQEALRKLDDSRVIMVKITPENAISTLKEVYSAEKCDVLSCDVDGDDVQIVKALIQGGCRPGIVVVEYNPTFPPFLYRLNPPGTNKGSSLKCVVDELNALEYDCVYATISNAIFVDRAVNGTKIRPMNVFEAFRWDALRFVCSDYDGQNHLSTITEIQETIVNPWDRLPSAKAMQYPTRMLGYDDARKRQERANHNHFGD